MEPPRQDKEEQTDRSDGPSGLSWPEEYQDLQPVIRSQWGIEGEIYLNRMLSGLSGARVYAADITSKDFTGQAILKFDRIPGPGWSEEKEAERHQRALDSEPDFGGKHLPSIVHALQHGEKVAILSTIAGRGLEYADPWAECPYKRQLATVRLLSAGLLEDWNRNYELAEGMHEPQDLLESWLGYRLDPEEGRIHDFLADDCGISAEEPSFSFQGHWYPNPLAFAKRVVPLPETLRLRAIKGNHHGDLHGFNVLVSSQPGAKSSYHLIDLAMCLDSEFLFYDHAYFELTHLLRVREDVSPVHWESILAHLSPFGHVSEHGGMMSDDLGILELVAALRREMLDWIDRHEPNRLSYMESQYLLARVAVGLSFVHKRLAYQKRCMALTYAASNLKDYVKFHGVDWPKHGPALDFQGLQEIEAEKDVNSSSGTRPVEISRQADSSATPASAPPHLPESPSIDAIESEPSGAEPVERRLAAILAADVVGYSRLMGEDEAGTHTALKALLKQLIEPKIAEHNGRIVKLMGDGLLVEFPSAVKAVECAVALQRTMGESNDGVPEDRRIVFRVGINIGDIIVESDDIYGDGVNVAARLEGLAEPGGICLSRTVFDQVKGKLDLSFEHLGEKEVKNIAEPLTVYRVVLDGEVAAPVTPAVRGAAKRNRRRWAATAAALVLLFLTAGGMFWWQPWAPDVEPASVERMAFPLPDKPSIAVLPFDNLSGDPTQDYLADGITENIITELSRFGGLFVIARNSVFTYKGKPAKVQQVAEELGVQYVLEGSMRRSGDQMRITAQLIDAVTGTHLWAQRYDHEMSDVFAAHDAVTEKIVASLGSYQGELAEAARERAKRKKPANLSAYEAFQLGIEHKHRFTREDNAAAQRLFKKAIELDPQFAQAYIGLGWFHIHQFWFGWADDPAQAVAQTREAAQKAIALDRSEAEAYSLLAEAYLADRRFEQGEAAYQRALALNPNNADLLAAWGYASVLLGEPERAAEFLEKAMRLNPHYPDWYDRGLGVAAYMDRRYEEAIAALRKVTQHVIESRLYLAASYAQLGRLEEARAEVAEAIAMDADISVAKFSSIELYKDPADLEHLRDGLRKAGLPE